ncbi:MAG TPA: peptide chain release factor N(5)-glutamine methyltransferase [Pedobacter sp.]|jgi:release factor glutamine methyltransferase
MTIAEIEEIFLEQMPGFYEKEEIKTIALLAVQNVCGISKSYYMLHKRKDLLLSEETALIRILDELRFGKPIQQVLGEADFFGLRFKVNSRVLVPRPETEELVHWVLESIKLDNILSSNILDIGTGSGCIPIAIKKNLPLSSVTAIDISKDALEIARQNCELNDVEVNLLEADILNADYSISNSGFDIIISNPPYITYSEKGAMHPNVLTHEPHEALFVPDENPLLFYKAIADFSVSHLNKPGYLFFEINEHYGDETIALLVKKGFEAELKSDLQGKHRMIRAFKA